VTGNTAGYSGSHAPVAHSQGTYLISQSDDINNRVFWYGCVSILLCLADGNDSDGSSSEECYQNIEIDENGMNETYSI